MPMTSQFLPPEADEMPWMKSYPEDIVWNALLTVRPVHELMAETCRKFPKRPAIDFMGKVWNWARIGDHVNRMARGLQLMGVGKGKRVGLFLPNSPYYLIAYYAVLRAGATVVNLNPLYSERELAHLIEDSQAEMVVTLDLKSLCDKMHPALHETRLKKLVVCSFADVLPFPKNLLFPLARRDELADLEHPERIVRYGDLIRNDGRPQAIDVNPLEDVAVLQYTGGTTGTPKGAMLTHANVCANVEQCALWFKNPKHGEERMMGVLPFFHVFAMTAVMNLSVRNGFEILALPRFDLEQTLALLDKKKPQYLPAVPAIFNAINNHPRLKEFDLKSLRYCISGGAPLPVEVKRTFEKNTGCVVVEGYGLSESSPVVCVNPIEGKNKPGSIGLPLPRTIVEIVDPEDKKTLMKTGERGELCVRGPQVMKGYWNKPQETADVLKDGRLHTGDVAIMDEEGYVFIVDRLKDMIITNGYKVYPRNVEEAIYLNPSVEECIVAGLPDAARGETVKVWVKLKAERVLTADDLREFLKDKISAIEMPRYIEFRDKPLPKTTIGKLSRKDILAEDAAKKG